MWRFDEPLTMWREQAQLESSRHPGGRPSDCTSEALTKAQDYLSKFQELGEVIPSIEGMALYIGVTRKTLHNWTRNPKYVEFLHIYERCINEQAVLLIQKGLTGEFNAALCSMMLTKHGYTKQSKSRNIVQLQEPTYEEKAWLDTILTQGRGSQVSAIMI